MTQVIFNPATGMMETVNEPTKKVTKADVDRTRRELRDMLSGNTQFHQEQREPPLPDIPDDENFGVCLDTGEFIPAEEVNRASKMLREAWEDRLLGARNA